MRNHDPIIEACPATFTAQSDNTNFLDGCGTTKGCVGYPYDCVDGGDACLFALSYKGLSEDSYEIEILLNRTQSSLQYVAAGLSYDDGMGEDSVMACIPEKNKLEMYWNIETTGSNRLEDPSLGIDNVEIGSGDGYSTCKFERQAVLELKDGDDNHGVFNLNLDKYFVLFASGRISGDDTIQEHTIKIEMDKAVRFGDFNEFYEYDFYLDCGDTKGCVGYPFGCLESKDCTWSLSFEGLSLQSYKMEIYMSPIVSSTWYVAAGLSYNDLMGDDSVMACLPSRNRVDMYWNYDDDTIGLTSRKLSNPALGISNAKVSEIDGNVICTFEREAYLDLVDGNQTLGVFDLNTDEYHILFASGRTNDVDDGTILEHGAKIALNTTVRFGDYNPYTGQIYTGCGSDKGCLGYPEGCVDSFDCTMLFTYKGVTESTYYVELQGFQEPYVAFALSEDTLMGEDAVIACTEQSVRRYWNVEGNSSLYDSNPTLGITNATMTLESAILTCTFYLQASFDIVLKDSTFTYDLNNKEYNILMARGPTANDVIGPHTEKANVTSEAISLANFNNFYGNDIYNGCGSNKGCFGMPQNCLDTQDCKVLVSYVMDENSDVVFTMVGDLEVEEYMALGLSFDDKMGDDSVTACFMEEDSTTVGDLMMTWNNPDKNKGTDILEDVKHGILDDEYTFEDGKFTCTFKRMRLTNITIPGTNDMQRFDLKDDEYYLLLAYGDIESTTLRTVSFMAHDMKAASSEAVNLGSFIVIEGEGLLDVKLHACFMVVAWLLLGGSGIFTARYGKKQFNNIKVMGKDLWFQIHRMFMVIAWTLSLVAFIIIVADKQFDPLTKSAIKVNPHAVLGLVSFCLMFIQPFMALMRPDPGSENRWIFNWAHMLVGLSGMVLAEIAVYFTTVESFQVQ